MESEVGVAEGVDGGGPGEDVEVVVGEGRVVVEVGFEEVEEGVWGEGRGEVGLQEVEEAVVLGGGDWGEGESGEGWCLWWWWRWWEWWVWDWG